jgi:hypothetical protein
MAKPKRKRVWRVQGEFSGRVAIESQQKRVVLSNELTDDQLRTLSKHPVAKGFMHQVYITIQPSEG